MSGLSAFTRAVGASGPLGVRPDTVPPARRGKQLSYVPRPLVADFLRRELRKRSSDHKTGVYRLAIELSAANGSEESWGRRINSILRGREIGRDGQVYEVQHVHSATVDRLLCALDMPEEWHITFADHERRNLQPAPVVAR